MCSIVTETVISCVGKWPSLSQWVASYQAWRRRRRPRLLGRQLDRQVAGLFALEYAGGVDAKKAITFVLIWAIAHEPASGGELTSRIQRRNRMASGQHHQLRGAREEEWIGRDQESIGAPLGQCCKSRVDVANAASIQNIDVLPNALGGGLNVTYLAFGLRDISRVHEDRDRRGMRPQVTEQPQPLRLHFGNIRGNTRDVATGTIQAGGEAGPYRIGARCEDDRYGRCRR